MISKIELTIHALIVAGILLIFNTPSNDLTVGVFNGGDGSLLIPSIYGTIINLILFYGVSLYLIPQILAKKGTLIFLIQLNVFFGILTAIEVILDSYSVSSYSELLGTDTMIELVLNVLIFHIVFLLLAFVHRFSSDWFESQRIKSEIGDIKVRTELELLKSQINPHFLFNALNNLFSMSLQHGDDDTAEGISKLSGMMRYVFEHSSSEKVSLTSEVEYLEDFIHLQKLRFNDYVTVHFDISHLDQTLKIAPMLLVPFLENAFKYGVSTQTKSEINLVLSSENQAFRMILENEIVEPASDLHSTGIGIQNVEKRLNLLYKNRHYLNIDRNEKTFSVTMELDLS